MLNPLLMLLPERYHEAAVKATRNDAVRPRRHPVFSQFPVITGKGRRRLGYLTVADRSRTLIGLADELLLLDDDVQGFTHAPTLTPRRRT